MIIIAGPTAVGKSEVALRLAEEIGAEILSVDSMQVYRGMDIGTAKPSAEERSRVPHHLVDAADLFERFDAARFAREASRAIAGIRSRGRAPLLCGGTGFYFSSLFGGVGEAPAGDPEVRRALAQSALPQLLEELAQKDPVAFAAMDRGNRRRVERAIEVIRMTGRPFSSFKSARLHPREAISIGLSRPPGELKRRIDHRVDQMFAAGLVEETRRLLTLGLEQNQVARQALGYRQVVEFLQGERSLVETIELVKIRTRQFAKRQMTWFRHQMDLEWISLAEHDETAVARQLARRWKETKN